MPKYATEHLDWVRFSFTEIVNSVSELHLKGYVHRDLKPSNFLIDSGTLKSISGKLKLNDFGLVIKQNRIDPSYCGTPSYMAP
jgi:serine/threonine protein kinase